MGLAMTDYGHTQVHTTGPMTMQWSVDPTRSHAYAERVDYQPQELRIDRRVKPFNRERRTNMRYQGERSSLGKGQCLKGTRYARVLTCAECGERLPRSHFYNRSVMRINRMNNGCNIRCRACNGGRKYTRQGYQLDGFVVDDDEEMEDNGPDLDTVDSDQEWTPEEQEY